MTDHMLTVADVCTRLNVHEATVRRWLKSGALKGNRLGGRTWRISEAELACFMAAEQAVMAHEAELEWAGYQQYLAEKQHEARLYQDVAELKRKVAALQDAVDATRRTAENVDARQSLADT